GAQALNDDALNALGRTHDAQAACAAVEAAARLFPQVSADFIYARAGQNLADWAQEMRAILALPAAHFSLYQLTIKPGTAFERAARRGALQPPDDDLAAAFYEATQDAFEAAGFPAYEISNHAREAGAQS